MPRFVPLTDVAETLSVSAAQAYALVRSGELPAIQVGGRGQWRVEVTELEAYIDRKYAETRQLVARRDPDRGPDGQPDSALEDTVDGPSQPGR
ncbi:MAG: helix-turn-helix domain-containing protein [Kineosporiaceae bacterium]